MNKKKLRAAFFQQNFCLLVLVGLMLIVRPVSAYTHPGCLKPFEPINYTRLFWYVGSKLTLAGLTYLGKQGIDYIRCMGGKRQKGKAKPASPGKDKHPEQERSAHEPSNHPDNSGKDSASGGSGGSSAPPPPDPSDSSGNGADRRIFHYFNPQALRNQLDSMSRMLKELDIVLILAVDIDDTILFRWGRQSFPVSFNEEQIIVLDIINEWLNQDATREYVLLIYNTGRDCFDSSCFRKFENQHLPLPSMLISSNGYHFHMPLAMPPPLASLMPDSTQRIVGELKVVQQVYKNHQQNLENALGVPLTARWYTTISEAINNGYQPTSTSGYIAAGSFYPAIKNMMENIARIPSARKACFSKEYTPATLLYDRVVNKGGALTLLLKHVMPYLSKQSMLFTSGDDIYDLPMLFMNFQSQAFLRPEQVNLQQLYEDYAEIGITAGELQQVIDIWQAGILPGSIAYNLHIALERSGLINSPKLMKSMGYGFPGLIDKLAEFLNKYQSGVSDIAP